MAEYKLEDIAGVLPEDFQVKAQGRNFQVSLKNMGQTSHFDVAERLVEETKALKAEGYEAEMRLSWPRRNQDGSTTWVPFPCIWVNQPRPEQRAAGELRERVDALAEKIDLILNALDKHTETPAQEDAPF